MKKSPSNKPAQRKTARHEGVTRSFSEASAKLERARSRYLAGARRVIIAYAARSKTAVTVDDVRRLAPPPCGIDARVLGVVFQPKVWRAVGYVGGKRASSHRRPIMAYALEEKRA